jgi:hypothetical protein
MGPSHIIRVLVQEALARWRAEGVELKHVVNLAFSKQENDMKSRVRFELVGRIAINQGCDYPASAISTEVANGVLTALSVEVEHEDHAALADIVQAARTALRHWCTLIAIGQGIEPTLGAARVFPITTGGPSIGLGFSDAQGRAVVVRRLKTLPPESLLARLQADPRLARQADYLNSAAAAEDIVSRFRYAYLVLEQETKKGGGYTPSDDFRRIRNALSHAEPYENEKAFLQAKIGADQLDLRNPTHASFLAEQCRILIEEARCIVEGYFASLGFRFWC